MTCGQANRLVDLDGQASEVACEHCGRSIASIGAHCPRCGSEVRSAFAAGVAAGTLRSAPFVPRWPFSAWYGTGTGGDAPPCPHCGEPVRAVDAPRETPFPGRSNPPWNAGWDGCCESCDAHFELLVYTPLHFNVDRTTTVRPASKPYRTFLDEGFVLSGVELTVTDRQWPTSAPSGSPEAAHTTRTLFLSMAELVSLARALDNDLGVYLDQFDWAHDWT